MYIMEKKTRLEILHQELGEKKYKELSNDHGNISKAMKAYCDQEIQIINENLNKAGDIITELLSNYDTLKNESSEQDQLINEIMSTIEEWDLNGYAPYARVQLRKKVEAYKNKWQKDTNQTGE